MPFNLRFRSRLRAAFFVPAFAVALLASVLSVYPPKAGHAQFVDQGTYSGTSTGSANAQAIIIPNLSAPMPGVILRFVPGFTNTGPATITINGLTAVSIVRPSSIGNVALSGAELFTGELTSVVYNWTSYQLAGNVDSTKIGAIVEFRGSVAPRGTLIEDGSCVSRSTYAALFSVIGTNYGGCDGSTTYALPDSRGTMFAALDNQGANGAANRITSAGSGCAATTLGLCGSQTHALIANELPNITPTFTGNGLSASFGGSAGGISVASQTSNIAVAPSAAGSFGYGNGGATTSGTYLGTGGGIAQIISTGSFTPAGTVSVSTPTGSVSGFGGNVAHSILNPISLGRRAIKY